MQRTTRARSRAAGTFPLLDLPQELLLHATRSLILEPQLSNIRNLLRSCKAIKERLAPESTEALLIELLSEELPADELGGWSIDADFPTKLKHSEKLMPHFNALLKQETVVERRIVPLGLRARVAEVLFHTGSFALATKLQREVMEERRATLGAKAEYTLIAISNLGGTLYEENQMEEAEKLHREALEGFRETLGSRHEHTLDAMGCLGNCLMDQEDYEGAGALHREVLAAQRERHGDKHPDTLVAINNVASVISYQGDLEGAVEMYKEVLQIRRETLCCQHPDLLMSIANLGHQLMEMDDVAGAEPLLLEALQGYRQSELQKDALGCVGTLGDLRRQQGRLDEAEALYREEVAGNRALHGPMHDRTLGCAEHLFQFLEERGDFQAAEELADEYGEYGYFQPPPPPGLVEQMENEAEEALAEHFADQEAEQAALEQEHAEDIANVAADLAAEQAELEQENADIIAEMAAEQAALDDE